MKARNYAETQQALSNGEQADEDEAWDELDQEFEDDDDSLDIDDIPGECVRLAAFGLSALSHATVLAPFVLHLLSFDLSYTLCPDFGDFEEVLSANRAEREQLADERRRQLRELYLTQASEQLKKQEYLLVKIKTRKEEEAAEKEAEKQAVVASTMDTLADMTFNFSFNESTDA